MIGVVGDWQTKLYSRTRGIENAVDSTTYIVKLSEDPSTMFRLTFFPAVRVIISLWLFNRRLYLRLLRISFYTKAICQATVTTNGEWIVVAQAVKVSLNCCRNRRRSRERRIACTGHSYASQSTGLRRDGGEKELNGWKSRRFCRPSEPDSNSLFGFSEYSGNVGTLHRIRWKTRYGNDGSPPRDVCLGTRTSEGGNGRDALKSEWVFCAPDTKRLARSVA